MNDQLAETTRPGRRDRIRVRLQRLHVSRQRGMFGPAEIIGLVSAVLMLVLVLISYLYLMVPARSKLESLQLERSRLQTELRSSQDVVSKGRSTETTVENISQSLDYFENKQLIGRNQGRMDLYDELNQLMRKNGLRNTSGPTYTPLEPAGSKTASSATKSASTKWQSVYPGIAISLTVEGQYQNLRRFVRDLEASKQFIIINTVELERATETNAAASLEGAPAGGHSALVSLRLDLATYFQRGSGEDGGTDAVGH